MTTMTTDTPTRLDLPVSLDAPLTAKTTLPRHPAAVSDARVWLRKTLTVWGAPETTTDTAVLLTSELCTNAVLHAVGKAGEDNQMTVTAAFWHGHLRVTVSDPDPMVYKRNPADDESGRGLDIVADVAERWGMSRIAAGKITFFELNAGGAL